MPKHNHARYDAAGNLFSDGAHSYFYDAESRISQVDGNQGNCSSLPTTACYAYNASGQRVRKTTVNSTGATSVDYLYDLASHEIIELSSTGVMNRGEVYAGNRHLATYELGSTFLNFSDWLGTERLRTLASGVTCETITSLPYGDNQSTSGACADSSPMHFTGKQRDIESGLDDFDARYYSSTLGRFISADWSAIPEPIPYADFDDPQSLNLYGYVRNLPTVNVDPNGHDGGFWEFVNALANAWTTDNVAGAGRQAQSTTTGRIGQAIGDAGAAVTGAAEVIVGAGGEIGGAALDLTGPGAILGVPLNVGSALVIAHGATASTAGVAHLGAAAGDAINDALNKPSESRGTQPGSRPGKDFTPAGRREIDARDADKCQGCGRDVRSVQNEKGQPTPPDQRQRHHILPKSEDGSGTPENGKTLCPDCHKKAHKDTTQGG